ncbi:MAG: ribokinase [Hydrogenibacillus schlegelii]|nr:ribokinase [Hydrogenibacillus schlegelii]
MRRPHIVVIGSLNLDLIAEVDRLPDQGETVLGKKAHMLPGGKGANQAVAARRLGAEVSFIGAVGRDAFGARLLEALRTEGIGTEGVKVVPDEGSGLAFITLAERDNRIIVVPGANARLTPDDVDRQAALIRAADVVLVQLEIPLEAVEKAVELARRYGVRVILNPAPARPLPAALLRAVDVLTPNRLELRVVNDLPPAVEAPAKGEPAAVEAPEEEESAALEAGVRALLARGVSSVVVTLGAEGAAYAIRDAHGDLGRLHRVPAVRVPVRDTTGAGDAFNGALAVALAEGRPLGEAVRMANRAAAIKVTRFGAQAGMPTRAELERWQE